jgi:hypothetical protein
VYCKAVKTLTVFLCCLVFSAQAAAPSAFGLFAGKWSGQLEYQDYKSPSRIKIPVKLEVKTTSQSSAIWDFNYDDFGRNVQSFETHTWKNSKYTVQTRGKLETQTYVSFDYEYFVKAGGGTSILFSQEPDNGKLVEVRRTIVLGKNSLTTLKEIRQPDGAFVFRNQSSYKRN